MITCKILRKRISKSTPKVTRLPIRAYDDILAGLRRVCPYSAAGQHMINLLDSAERACGKASDIEGQ